MPGHVAYLAWQLRAVHIDDSTPITGEIQKLVLDHLQEWLRALTAEPVSNFIICFQCLAGGRVPPKSLSARQAGANQLMP